MNREKEDQLPLMQVGFIDSICLPIYEVRSKCYSFRLRSISIQIGFRFLKILGNASLIPKDEFPWL